MLTKIQKKGDDLILRIPHTFITNFDIQREQDVDLQLSDKNLIIKFLDKPLPRNREDQKKKTLSQLLLEGPVWSEEEIKSWEKNVKQGYENWKIEEF